MSGVSWSDLVGLLPVLILVAGGSLLCLLEVTTRAGERGDYPWLTAAFAAIAAIVAISRGPVGAVFGGAAVIDPLTVFFTGVVCAALALGALTAPGYLRARGIDRGEFYGLAAFSASGMILLAASTNLLVMFVSLETMSIATYALVALRRDQARSAEAAMKYLVLGAFSSALFLYGVALLYATAGSLDLEVVARAAGGGEAHFWAGAALATSGFAFKVAAVPFHMWTPDVYEGAPTPVTGFMAAGVKAAAFAALIRLLLVGIGAGAPATTLGGWGTVIYALAALSLVAGNLLAIVQDNVKRILAYSSIAHAGYALLAVTAAAWGGPAVTSSVLFYLLVYGVTAVGAFGVVSVAERVSGRRVASLDEMAGFARRSPGLALAMTVFLFSLAGVPPTGGFIAKLDVFRALFHAARAAGAPAPWLYGLGVLGVLTSVAGVYYYLRIAVWMYMKPGEEAPPKSSAALKLGVALAAAGVLWLGLMPGRVSRYAQDAVQASFGVRLARAVERGSAERGRLTP
ncbi:MAG: NADH-quinone oxidoreductase subunit N [Deltaproteobacteria bacterium]|nr:MAG: NADH-quinone oxidoreductase subunit N [Deltaproteobacteria bacterium]